MSTPTPPKPLSQVESSDDFVLPVAPPRPQKSERSSSDPAAISKENLLAADADGTTVNKSEQQAPVGSGEAINTDSSCARNPIRILPYMDESASHSTVREPVNTSAKKNLDDHPLVAIVLVLLTVVATVFLGGIALNVDGGWLFLFPLFLIYGIALNFFQKKRARERNNE